MLQWIDTESLGETSQEGALYEYYIYIELCLGMDDKPVESLRVQVR